MCIQAVAWDCTVPCLCICCFCIALDWVHVYSGVAWDCTVPCLCTYCFCITLGHVHVYSGCNMKLHCTVFVCLLVGALSPVNHTGLYQGWHCPVFLYVLSHLDYCNSLLSGCPQHLLDKVWKIQDSAAHLVLRVSTTDHISPHLAALHWLPTDSWIQYKLSSLSAVTASVWLLTTWLNCKFTN